MNNEPNKKLPIDLPGDPRWHDVHVDMNRPEPPHPVVRALMMAAAFLMAVAIAVMLAQAAGLYLSGRV